MTREEFFQTANHIYMFTDRIKKAWERILPENGIVSFYQAERERLENGTYKELWYILTDKFLYEITITPDNLVSKAYTFNPYCIEKKFVFVRDFDYIAKVDEIKIYMEKGDPSPITIRLNGDRMDTEKFLSFIGSLS